MPGSHPPKLPAGVEIAAPFPDDLRPARHVRSTVILASLENLRQLGRYDLYVQRLAPEHHAMLLNPMAATWLPIAAAQAHYETLDLLSLKPDDLVAMGKKGMERIGRSIVGTSVSVAKQAGATPWTLLPHLQRFWRRAYDGGGIAVFKLGPKDARVDLVQFALCPIPAYRRVLSGWLTNLTEMFCSKVYMHDKGSPHGPYSFSLRVQWV